MRLKTRLFYIFFITTSFLLSTSCNNEQDHDEVPVGIVLSQGENLLVVQDEGTVTYANDNDALEIPAESSTGTVSVEFISEDGHYYTPDAGEFSLQYTIEDSDILEITHPVDGDEWSIQFIGSQPGNTMFYLELMHGGHADFQSRNFEVLVTDS